MTTRVLIGVGLWLLFIAVAMCVWVGYHEIHWRARQRRRRHTPISFEERRL